MKIFLIAVSNNEWAGRTTCGYSVFEDRGRDNALQSCDRESLTSKSAVITN